MIRGIVDKLLFKYVRPNWNIGIGVIGHEFEPERIRWMKHHCKDRWFADPFFLKEDDVFIYILSEEYSLVDRKGRISRLKLRKTDLELVSTEALIDVDTHLSFPIIINVDGSTFICPENSASGSLSAYLFEGDKATFYSCILPSAVADPVIQEINGEFYLFCTDAANCNGNVLNIYRSRTALRDYSFYQSITFPDNIARRAGMMFEEDGILYSPAQVCNNDYGEAVSLQKVEFDNGVFQLTETCRLNPLSNDYPHGFHTYNLHNKSIILDGYKYRHPTIRNLFFKIRNLF